MERKRLSISEVSKGVLESISQSGVGKNSQYCYKRIFQYLQHFYDLNGKFNYCPTINREFLDVKKKSTKQEIFPPKPTGGADVQ
jgi:hypothetical protein